MSDIFSSEDNELDIKETYDLDEPKRFKVVLHNDDYTTMDFVVTILEDIFNKTTEQAHEIMLKVHQEGAGVCGVYCFEVAETKSQKVEQLASQEGHPLKVSVEEE